MNPSELKGRDLAGCALVLLAAAIPVLAGPSKAGSGTGQAFSSGQIDYCRILQGCKLSIPPGSCPSSKEIGPSTFAFDAERCLEARTLQSRGVGPSHPLVGYPVYRFLGMEYRVIYEVTDTLNLSAERLEFMLNDLPLAARLVSHYQKTPYSAGYTDLAHLHFQGTKGKRLRGEARLISGTYAEKRLFYFGSGTAEVAIWTLKGPALMDFTYWQIPDKPGKSRRLGYKMKILVFPGNGFINKIMNLGMFRKIVFGKIRDVLGDITETARKLEAAGGSDLLKDPAWSLADKQKILAFFKTP